MRGRREAERRQKGSRTEAGWSDICRRNVIERWRRHVRAWAQSAHLRRADCAQKNSFFVGARVFSHAEGERACHQVLAYPKGKLPFDALYNSRFIFKHCLDQWIWSVATISQIRVTHGGKRRLGAMQFHPPALCSSWVRSGFVLPPYQTYLKFTPGADERRIQIGGSLPMSLICGCRVKLSLCAG